MGTGEGELLKCTDECKKTGNDKRRRMQPERTTQLNNVLVLY